MSKLYTVWCSAHKPCNCGRQMLVAFSCSNQKGRPFTWLADPWGVNNRSTTASSILPGTRPSWREVCVQLGHYCQLRQATTLRVSSGLSHHAPSSTRGLLWEARRVQPFLPGENKWRGLKSHASLVSSQPLWGLNVLLLNFTCLFAHITGHIFFTFFLS